jgi:Arc/MetJ family transcription regulator
MRTNIDIDDELLAAALRYSGKGTKKGAVEEALRHYNRAKAFRALIDARIPDWDDGLGTVERLENQRRLHAAEDGAGFDREK